MNLAVRNKIVDLEHFIKECPQLDIEIKHTFAKGLYARTMFMPAGALVVGKIHLLEHLCIISKGIVHVVTDTSKVEIHAPELFVSCVGDKRALFAIEDTVWTTIHATEETDIDIIEASFVSNEYTPEVLKLIGER